MGGDSYDTVNNSEHTETVNGYWHGKRTKWTNVPSNNRESWTYTGNIKIINYVYNWGVQIAEKRVKPEEAFFKYYANEIGTALDANWRDHCDLFEGKRW